MRGVMHMRKRYFKGIVCIGAFLLIGIIVGFLFTHFHKNDVTQSVYSYEEDENAYSLIADEYVIRIYKSAWNDVQKLGYYDACEFLSYCGECIKYVSDRTGKTEWMNELTNISEEGKAIVSICAVQGISSRTKFPEGNVFLNMRNKLNKKDLESVVAHELTHLVMGENSEGTLSEGFATYMEYVEFGDGNFEFHGININVLLQNFYFDDEYKDLTKDILEVIGAAYDPSIKHKEHGWTFYLYAGSYIYYLVNNYGMEAVVGIYDEGGSDASYESFTGKDMLTIKSEWLKDLQQYDGEMSSDEIIAILFE